MRVRECRNGREKWHARKSTVGDEVTYVMNDPQLDESPRLPAPAEEYVRKEPAKAVSTAFGAGFILSLLPLGAIVAGLIGLAISLLRPALLVLGVMKACELYRLNPQPNSDHERIDTPQRKRRSQPRRA